MAKEYEAYFFDWDGTIAKTVEVWMSQIRRWLDKYNLTATDEELSQHFGDWRAPILYGLPAEKLDEFNQRLVASTKKELPRAALYDGAPELLERLGRKRKRSVLITSSGKESIDVLIHRHEVAEQFELIITADDVTEHKPHPEGIQQALSRLAIPPEAAVMVGDTGKDLGAARNAGIDSVLFYPDSHRAIYDIDHLMTFEPTRVVHRLEDVYP